MLRRIRQRHKAPEELNITSFMNLMVILVPFLLITAVFSKIVVLELNIPLSDPSQKEASKKKDKKLQLDVIARKSKIVVSNRNGKIIKTIANKDGEYDYTELSKILKLVKTKSPDTMAATILAEADVPYAVIIKLMDTIRVGKVLRGGNAVQVELFPNVAIGDAPTASGTASKGKKK